MENPNKPQSPLTSRPLAFAFANQAGGRYAIIRLAPGPEGFAAIPVTAMGRPEGARGDHEIVIELAA